MTDAAPVPNIPADRLVLVIESEDMARDGVCRLLELEGYRPSGARDGAEALRKALEDPPDAILLEEDLQGESGLDLLDRLRSQGVTAPVILTSDRASVEGAVAAMRKGAAEYLHKPLDLDQLLLVLQRVGEQAPASPARAGRDQGGLLGNSPAIQDLVQSIRTAAGSSAAVLILGETGVGKELVARLVHDWGERAGGPFVPLHCAALSEGLLESELFGHEKGAFTGAVKERKGRFEEADGGTLFLDELGEVSPAVQVKLLRVLETGAFERVGGNRTRHADVRLVSATHRDLAAEVEAGRFREDLFYRLNVITLRVPPLRERGDDLGLLANAFVRRFAERYQKRILGFTPEALDAVLRYPWPGNVRELQGAIERAVIFATADRIDPSALPEGVRPVEADGPALVEIPVGTSLAEAERLLTLRTLEACGGNRAKAARVLGVSDRKIRYKLREWGES